MTAAPCKASSTKFSLRPTAETLADLSRPIDPRHLKTRKQGTATLTYYPWNTIARHLHHRAPGWCWEVQSDQEVGGAVVVTGRLTILTADGSTIGNLSAREAPDLRNTKKWQNSMSRVRIKEYANLDMHGQIKLIVIGALVGISAPLFADFKWIPKANAGEVCTYTIKNKTSYKFDCRWMINGSTKKTIFVDNNETGDRYEVGEYNYKIGPSSNCINKYAVTICTKKWW